MVAKGSAEAAKGYADIALVSITLPAKAWLLVLTLLAERVAATTDPLDLSALNIAMLIRLGLSKCGAPPPSRART